MSESKLSKTRRPKQAYRAEALSTRRNQGRRVSAREKAVPYELCASARDE